MSTAQCRLLNVGQYFYHPTMVSWIDTCSSSIPVVAVHGIREHVEHIVIVVQSQANLLQIVFALGPSRSLTGLLDRREKQSNQNRDDRDHDQQFDQRKGFSFDDGFHCHCPFRREFQNKE